MNASAISGHIGLQARRISRMCITQRLHRAGVILVITSIADKALRFLASCACCKLQQVVEVYGPARPGGSYLVTLDTDGMIWSDCTAVYTMTQRPGASFTCGLVFDSINSITFAYERSCWTRGKGTYIIKLLYFHCRVSACGSLRCRCFCLDYYGGP